MKKLLLTLCLVALSTSFAWTDDTVYCSPYGISVSTNPSDGDSWNNTLTPSGISTYLNGNHCRLITNPGVLTIYILKGDYYDDLIINASTISNLISLGYVTSVNIYGSCSGNNNELLNQRDFENGRSVFHAASGNCPIWLDFGSATHGNICVVDGLWIDSYDGNQYQTINEYAMRLVGGNYIISHCTIQDFKTTNSILFLEGGNEYFRLVNSVITGDEAEHLLDVYGSLQIINSTIAKLELGDKLIGISMANHTYRIDNSIIYDCSNYVSCYGYPFDIRNSIIRTYDSSWMVDYGNNYWNTDPAFTGYPTAPYSCQASSVAMGNGAVANYTALSFMLNLLVVLYDADNHFRFDDYSLSRIDIGAYQTYSGGNYYYQNALAPNPMQAPQRQTEVIDEIADDDASGMVYNLLGQPVDESYHGIVIKNGQKVLQ